MKIQPQVAVLTGYGLNSDRELAHCFTRAGFATKQVHVGDLIAKVENCLDYQVLAFPGGFSFGDHIASGKVLANKLKSYLADELLEFISGDGLILGICNGFQVLVKLGVLPNADLVQKVSLVTNKSGVFEDRWVDLHMEENGPWLAGLDRLKLPVRHGEGRLVADDAVWKELKENESMALKYLNAMGAPTEKYPENPNGTKDGIAGIVDRSGKIFGLMPHPEAFMDETNAPGWKYDRDWASDKVKAKLKPGDGAGMAFFYNARSYFE